MRFSKGPIGYLFVLHCYDLQTILLIITPYVQEMTNTSENRTAISYTLCKGTDTVAIKNCGTYSHEI